MVIGESCGGLMKGKMIMGVDGYGNGGTVGIAGIV